ncbi:hypothetical protein AX14_006276 [Amanita brunnescens Koide BX004]|nr:hypothetical protein AX14_006276 [Amanita brunnescens Koide BX004]
MTEAPTAGSGATEHSLLKKALKITDAMNNPSMPRLRRVNKAMFLSLFRDAFLAPIPPQHVCSFGFFVIPSSHFGRDPNTSH